MGQEELSATLSTRNDQFLHTEDSHMNGLTIRRLTPLECERLQGFPDGWTDIPWRGREHARTVHDTRRGEFNGRSGHEMDRRRDSTRRRSRRNNRVDNRDRWIVAEEGATSSSKNNTAIGHDLVQGFPFVRRNHQKQEESWPSLDYKKICHVCSMTISTARQPL
mgnify:CR=1 FL=1